jgi:hypothetical protein
LQDFKGRIYLITKEKGWFCPHCPQTCPRRWNLKIHIKRKHNGIGDPLEAGLTSTNSTTSRFAPHTGVSSRKEEQQRPKKQIDLVDEMHETLRKMVEEKKKIIEIQEFRRQLFPSIQQPTILGDIPIGSIPLPSFSDWSSLTISLDDVIHALRDNIIQLKGIVCKSCLGSMIVPVCRITETNKIIDPEHFCDPKRIAKIQEHGENERQIIIQDLHRKLPEEMKKAVKVWTGNTTYLISLQLKEINKNSIELTKIIHNDIDHWTIRAMKEGQTVIDDNELLDFLKLGNNNITTHTAKYFHLNFQEESIPKSCSYLMLISKIHLGSSIINDLKNQFFFN